MNLRSLFWILLTAGAVLAAAGCRLFRGATLPLEELNVVLIVIDTLGAKHLGRHTPNINKLAEKGVRFSQAYSPAPWTKPAIASIVTGLMPSHHGMTGHRSRLGEDKITLAERLKARGFDTAGVVSHLYLLPKAGIPQGIDELYEFTSRTRMHEIITSDKVSDKAVGWLQARAGAGNTKAFFLFLHYFDPHYNYLHHPDFDLTAGYQGELTPGMPIRKLWEFIPSLSPEDLEYLKGLYHEEAAFTDFHIGRVLEAVEKLSLPRKTLILLTADHGEEFMEHGWIGHTRTLYDELIHVPLIAALPGTFAPAVVEEPVSTVDIVPTLLAMLREPDKTGRFDGASLLPLLEGKRNGPRGRRLMAEVDYESETIKDACKTALMEGPWKAVHDRRRDAWHLYDRAADPAEQKDLAAERPEVLKSMADAIRHWENQAAASAPGPTVEAPSTEEVEQLKTLGYM